MARYHWNALVKIGSSPYYFAVSKYRPDILEELNDANIKVLQSDWYYNEKVYVTIQHPVQSILFFVQNRENKIFVLPLLYCEKWITFQYSCQVLLARGLWNHNSLITAGQCTICGFYPGVIGI